MLLPVDRITMNREQLLHDAKSAANWRRLFISGTARDIPAPGENMLASLAWSQMRQGEFISDHDVKVANGWRSFVAGGCRDAGERTVFVGSEREAFLSLCGEKKTQGGSRSR
jgi:3-hydroxyacyl-CoA dehydrogenase